jgi:GNAT superfamily N-acetyltransferase
MNITLKEVTNRKQLIHFIDFPILLYRGNPYYVPSLLIDEINCLSQEKNPAFEHCQAKYWLAYKDGQIAGRVAAILNQKHIEKWGQRYLRFGWLDFIDDPDVSAALLEAVMQWARSLGLDAIHGPLGFTDMDREGMLIEGFSEVATLATLYNHPYYPQHMEKLGFIKDIDWVEYEISVPVEQDPTIARIADISLRRNRLHLLKARNKRDLLKYANELFELLDESYSHLYGTVPLTRKQVDTYIHQYFGFVKPDFVPIVLDEKGKMVAFGIVMPSLSKGLQRSRGHLFPFGFVHMLKSLASYTRFDLYLVAVAKEYQSKGVNAILMNQMNQVFNALGVRYVESNPELEINANVQGQWKYYQRRQHKRRRVFIKPTNHA